MNTIEQIRAAFGSEVREDIRGYYARPRQEVERIIRFTDEELLDALCGGEKGAALLFGGPGSPRCDADVEGRATSIYFCDPGVAMDLDFFCTAEAVRRGMPERRPWQIDYIGRSTGPMVFHRMHLAQAVLALQVVAMTMGRGEDKPVRIGDPDNYEENYYDDMDEEMEAAETARLTSCEHCRQPLSTLTASPEEEEAGNGERPWWWDEDENPDW